MKFALDLIYIDRKHVVKAVVRDVKPWRLSACFSAHSVIELPAGRLSGRAPRRAISWNL